MPIESDSPMHILCECVESVKKLGDYFQCSVCCKTMIDVHINVQTMRRCCHDCRYEDEIKERSGPDIANDLSQKGETDVFLRDEQFEELVSLISTIHSRSCTMQTNFIGRISFLLVRTRDENATYYYNLLKFKKTMLIYFLKINWNNHFFC